jgi:hypothetical protein
VNDIEFAAKAVAGAARNEHRGTWTGAAQVEWKLIYALRDALRAADIKYDEDWE